MVARDRCGQQKHPVWKYMLFCGLVSLAAFCLKEREGKEVTRLHSKWVTFKGPYYILFSVESELFYHYIGHFTVY